MTNQNDFIIDNGTGLAVRQDIQDALQALAGLSSGDSAPLTTYAFQLYANTTDNKLQLRNAANSAFVNLRGFDGSIILPAGTEGQASLSFDGDPDTGIFSSEGNSFSVTTSGVEKMKLGATTIFNDSGADIDFRIESDSNANCFKLNAGTSGIGINQDPANGYGLDILGNSGFDDVLRLTAVGTNIGARMNLTPTGTGIPRINGTANALQLQTIGNAALHIDSNQNVGIGTTTITSTGIQSGIKTVQIDSGDGAELILGNSQSSGVSANHLGAIAFKNIDTSTGTAPHYAGIRCNATDNSGGMNLKFYAGLSKFETDSPHMLIDSSGNVGIGTTTIGEKLTIGDGDLKFFNSDSANNHRTTFIEFTSSSNRITSESNYGSDGSSNYSAGYKFTTKNFTGSAFVTVDAFNIQANGNVGIGLTAPSQKLHVSGNILATGTITPNSDIAFKKDIEPLTNVLNKVTQLIGINFTYKNNDEKSMGLVAQDVEKVFPELVRGEEGNKSLNYMGLTGALIEAIKELSAKVEALERA